MVSITFELSEEFINKIANSSVDDFMNLIGKRNPISAALTKVAYIKMQEDIKDNEDSMIFINSDNVINEHLTLFTTTVAESYMLSKIINKDVVKE